MTHAVKEFLLVCAFALGTLAAPLLFGTQPVFAILALALLSILMLLMKGSRDDFILYLLVFVSGPTAEAVAIHFGAWSYARPVIAGVPLWLPFVWGNAALYVVQLKRIIDGTVSLPARK